MIPSAQGPTHTNTDKIKIFFKEVIPEYLYIYSNFRQINLFIQSILRCKNCQQYTHSTNQCHNMRACVRCSYAHQDSELCTYSERCANCDGPHRADSKVCPEFLFFKEVTELKATEMQ